MKKILFLVLGFTLVMGAGASALVASDVFEPSNDLAVADSANYRRPL